MRVAVSALRLPSFLLKPPLSATDGLYFDNLALQCKITPEAVSCLDLPNQQRLQVPRT